jgi:hypothetical protein
MGFRSMPGRYLAHPAKKEEKGPSELYRNDMELLTIVLRIYNSELSGVILYSSTAVADGEADDVQFGEFVSASADACGC